MKLIKVQFHGFGIEDEDADPELVFLSRLTGILALRKMIKGGIRIHFASPFEETVYGKWVVLCLFMFYLQLGFMYVVVTLKYY